MNQQESESFDRCMLELIAVRQENAALKTKVAELTSHNNARDEIAAAEKLCKIYFDIAASCIGEDSVRQRVAAATSPVA
jgi:hypothetical protein